MTLVELSTPELLPSTKREPVCGAQEQTANFACLVASRRRERRELLSQAALEAGWHAQVCADVEMALAAHQKIAFRLALIDIESSGASLDRAYRQLCHTLTGSANLLLMVCGRQSVPEEEIWARQLGVWLYLPGIADRDAVCMLCREARVATEKCTEAADLTSR